MTRVERIESEINETISLFKMHLRITPNPHKYNQIKEKLNELVQSVANINSKLAQINDIAKSLPEDVAQAKKTEETSMLLSKLKQAYEVKFRDLESSNLMITQEIRDLRHEAEDQTRKLTETKQKSSEYMEILEKLEQETAQRQSKIEYLNDEKEELRQNVLQTAPSSSSAVQKEIQELQKSIASLEESIALRKERNNKELKLKDTEIENLQRKLNQKEREADLYKDA